MKTVLVFAIFVLAAFLHLRTDAAVFRGYSKDCKKPENIKNTCHRFQCADGEYTVSTCGVISITCPKGQVANRGKEDLTKGYPDCCAKPFCC